MIENTPKESRFRVRWLRWVQTAFLSAATFLAVFLPLQAVEIFHFRIYETLYEPLDQYALVVALTVGTAVILGLLMGLGGVLRERFLGHSDQPWPLWVPVVATIPAALAVHVLEQLPLAALALLAHVVAAAGTSEKRWLRLGAVMALLLTLPFSNPVRHLYTKHVIRIFHFYRLRYMDVFIRARKGGEEAPPAGKSHRPYPSSYMQSIDELPVEPAELFWMGIVSVTEDPWGHPYRFVTSRALLEGVPQADFGRWEIDYVFSSLGADGRDGGLGDETDIFPEDALVGDEIPPSRIRPIKPPEVKNRSEEAAKPGLPTPVR